MGMLSVEKWFWLIFIIVTAVNAFIFKSRSQNLIAQNPELREGYDKLFKGYLIFLNIPWLVMGIGILSGSVSGMFDYFNPRAGNPFVLAFHLSVVTLWILSIYWIYFRNGAEFLIKHPGVFGNNFKSALAVKLIYLLMLLCGVFALVLMWTRDFPPLKQ